MKKIDNIISFVILIIAVFYGYCAIKLPRFGGLIGAAFFPKILAVVLISLCLLFILINSRNSDAETETIKFSDIQIHNLIKPVTVVTLIGVYAYSLFQFGFKIPTFILLISMMFIYGEKNWKKTIIIALVTTILFDLIFRGLFKVPIREIQIF